MSFFQIFKTTLKDIGRFDKKDVLLAIAVVIFSVLESLVGKNDSAELLSALATIYLSYFVTKVTLEHIKGEEIGSKPNYIRVLTSSLLLALYCIPIVIVLIPSIVMVAVPGISVTVKLISVIIAAVALVFLIMLCLNYNAYLYIIVSNPELSARNVLKASKELIKGFRGTMFGYNLILVIIAVAVISPLEFLNPEGVSNVLTIASEAISALCGTFVLTKFNVYFVQTIADMKAEKSADI